MDAASLRKFLKEEFGINNDEEFEVAVEKSTGVNLGIFTQPFKGGNDDKKTEKVAVA